MRKFFTIGLAALAMLFGCILAIGAFNMTDGLDPSIRPLANLGLIVPIVAMFGALIICARATADALSDRAEAKKLSTGDNHLPLSNSEYGGSNFQIISQTTRIICSNGNPSKAQGTRNADPYDQLMHNVMQYGEQEDADELLRAFSNPLLRRN